MAREQVIVGVGEVFSAELAEREAPAGLAADVARAAVRIGQVGVAVSRLGQDRAGAMLTEQLREIGIDTSHLQSDPDLPTPRLRVDSGIELLRPSLAAPAAFDNLQWDHDLADVAHEADAVLFGTIACREGQARSVVQRMLEECSRAIRVFDLTNRAGDEVRRDVLRWGIEICDVAIVDDVALAAIAAGARRTPRHDVIDELLSRHRLQAMVWCGGTPAATMIELRDRQGASGTVDGAEGAPVTVTIETRTLVTTVLVHGILSRASTARCVEVAARVAAFVGKRSDEALPHSLLHAE